MLNDVLCRTMTDKQTKKNHIYRVKTEETFFTFKLCFYLFSFKKVVSYFTPAAPTMQSSSILPLLFASSIAANITSVLMHVMLWNSLNYSLVTEMGIDAQFLLDMTVFRMKIIWHKNLFFPTQKRKKWDSTIVKPK